MSASPSPRTCHACGHGDLHTLTSVRGTTIVQCPKCKLATWDWAHFDSEAFYDASYWQSDNVGKGYADYFALADALVATNQKRLKLIERLRGGAVPPGEQPLKLLDAGCGPGFFVRAAHEAGYDAAGVEVSQFAVDFARGELGLNLRQGQVCKEDLPAGPFDVITLWDVIEHLPDPAQAIADLAAALAPNGLLLLSTGDVDSIVAKLSGARWHLFTLPEHLWFFTPASLRTLMERAGLDVVDRRYEVCWYPIRYLTERLEAMFVRRRVVSPLLGPVGRITLPVTLADVVTMAARKPA
jgi:2-polyprenyl-3-methyl-5-hydroxy-6-metoxy-1,4-benzoquinol methylase